MLVVSILIKTESAVRITHIPTGTVVASQAQRSQLKNREQAMSMLKSQIISIGNGKRKPKKQQVYVVNKWKLAGAHKSRSYVFHPYSMVKDHRTNYETGNVQAVMDGDLDGFIDAYLKTALKLSSSLN